MSEEIIKVKKSELESLVEEKVQKEMEKRNSDTLLTQNSSKTDISRRNFLKKAGLSALGLGALLSPVSGLSVKDSSFDVFTGSSSSDLTSYLSVGQGGPVNIQNTSLDLNNQNITNVNLVNGYSLSSFVDGSNFYEANASTVFVNSYSTQGDVPSGLQKGSLVFIEDDGSLYVEDGT